MIDLSILIPARNEEWLDRTIQDILENVEGNTEIIAILDGYLPDPPLSQLDKRITIIYNPQVKGQRAATNQAAKLAKGKYLMKCDAHVAFDKGFDVKMIEAFKKVGDNVTMIPVMKNLHVYDWVCTIDKSRKYQGKDNICSECGKQMEKEVLWFPKPSPNRFTFVFDKTMHFQYYGSLAKRKENIKGALLLDKTYDTNLRETMSIQGSCFMLTKEKYFKLDICSEEFHSWGQQGVEVACKTWLSGGRVISNLNTWYAHMFRTNNFGGFPYSNPQPLIDENRELSRELFQRDKWNKAIHKFQWLLDKFNPPYWKISKGMIYYTDNQINEKIKKPVITQLIQIGIDNNISIVTSSLKNKLGFGVDNIFFPSMKRGYESMFRQILSALEHSNSDIIFFTEHDILYHPSHFEFIPEKLDTFYYNQNVWFVRSDGFALHYDVNQLSGLCVYKETAITHFKERIERIKKEGFSRNMGFEPFTHGRIEWDNDFKMSTWKSSYPNIDIRVGVNITGMRWKKEEYRNQQLLINWQESTIDKIPGWSKLPEIMDGFK